MNSNRKFSLTKMYPDKKNTTPKVILYIGKEISNDALILADGTTLRI